MLILERVTTEGELAPTGIPLTNFIGCNQNKDGKVWVSYWDGEKVYKMPVNQTLVEIQERMFVARHGKRPAKGVLGV